jgi:limonene-1,2-epoxide hydrolase
MAILADVGPNPHPNVRFVVDSHEKLGQGRVGAIRDAWTPGIVWHEWGRSGLSGTYVGVEAVLEFWKVFFSAAGPHFTQDITAITANDVYVTSIVRISGRKGTRTLEQTVVDVMRMEQSRLAEFWRYYADVTAAHEFFAS